MTWAKKCVSCVLYIVGRPKLKDVLGIAAMCNEKLMCSANQTNDLPKLTQFVGTTDPIYHMHPSCMSTEAVEKLLSVPYHLSDSTVEGHSLLCTHGYLQLIPTLTQTPTPISQPVYRVSPLRFVRCVRQPHVTASIMW